MTKIGSAATSTNHTVAGKVFHCLATEPASDSSARFFALCRHVGATLSFFGHTSRSVKTESLGAETSADVVASVRTETSTNTQNTKVGESLNAIAKTFLFTNRSSRVDAGCFLLGQ